MFYVSGLTRDLGPLYPSPDTGMNFSLGSSRFPRWEDAKDPGDEFRRQIRETKQHGEAQKY